MSDPTVRGEYLRHAVLYALELRKEGLEELALLDRMTAAGHDPDIATRALNLTSLEGFVQEVLEVQIPSYIRLDPPPPMPLTTPVDVARAMRLRGLTPHLIITDDI